MFKTLVFLFAILFAIPIFAGESNVDSLTVDTEKKVELKGRKDTASVVLAKKPKNPKIAGLLSTFIPGAGQVYNGRWWKVPIIYGGGYLLYSGINHRAIAKDFYKGLLVIKDQEGTDAEIASYVDSFKNKSSVTDLTGAEYKNVTEAEMKSYYDDYSSKLQNLYIFSVVLYSLNILDAVVDAHLKSFDVSDNLAMKIKPGIINSIGTYGGIGPSIGVQFSLK